MVTGRTMRPISIIRLLFALASVLAFPPEVQAEKRVALLIGNQAYKVGDKLANPVSDGKLIATSLKTARFENIDLKVDLGIAEFRQSLRRFQSHADGAEVALIYYAGHAVEVNGVNWLVPTDGELRETRDLEYEAIRLDLALQALAGARMRILVLDACRNNPFGRSWQAASRVVSRGLNRQEADNVLVLFAAAPGQLASDGNGPNSPFATALAKRLPEEGLALQMLGGRVRDDVIASTGDNQRPYVSASITGEPFYLVPSKNAAPSAAHQIELVFWSSVKDSTSASVLRTYLDRYPNGEFAVIAKALIAHYEQQAKLSLAAQEEERKRQEEAKRRAELRRIEVEQRARENALAEERLKATQAKNLIEVKRIEEQERAEHAARLSELQRAKEEARIAKEAAKAAEEQRLAAVRAAEKAAKSAEQTLATTKNSIKQGDPSKVAAIPKIEKPAPRDPLAESLKYWPNRTLRYGQTETATTPDGRKLTCIGGSPTEPRKCRWH
jgi:uncharacterized caspase-like protein